MGCRLGSELSPAFQAIIWCQQPQRWVHAEGAPPPELLVRWVWAQPENLHFSGALGGWNRQLFCVMGSPLGGGALGDTWGRPCQVGLSGGGLRSEQKVLLSFPCDRL